MNNLFKQRQEQLQIFHRSRKKVIHYVKKEVPEDLFQGCPHCNYSIKTSDLKKHLYVCERCGYHIKVSAYERIYQIVDKGSFIETDKYMESKNKDRFIGYDEKLEKYKSATGLHEAVVCGSGKIEGKKVAIAVMDSQFMMGSMGAVVGEKITKTIEMAKRKKLPLIIFCASGGGRMQEGIISLMQMAKTSSALKRFSDEKGLYISVLTNPTTGGVSASFAMLGDIILAEPDALIGFAGKRVIEKTINETLPPQFQHAEFVEEKGFIDRIVERKDMRKTLSDLIRLHGGNS